MTVQDVIDNLSKFKPDMEVMIMIPSVLEALDVRSVYRDRNQYEVKGSKQVIMISPSEK